MKKIYFILTVLIIFFLFNNKDEIITVFNTNDYYEIDYLDVRDANLNTENFLDYFDNDDIDILKIEPYINPVYKNKIDFDTYLFNYSSKKNNIKIFKNIYLEKIKNINYDDYCFYRIKGVKIDLVKVYSTEENIKKILKKNKNVKYVFNYTDYSKV